MRRLRRPRPRPATTPHKEESQTKYLRAGGASGNPLKRLVSDERIQAIPTDLNNCKQGFSGVGRPERVCLRKSKSAVSPTAYWYRTPLCARVVAPASTGP